MDILNCALQYITGKQKTIINKIHKKIRSKFKFAKLIKENKGRLIISTKFITKVAYSLKTLLKEMGFQFSFK